MKRYPRPIILTAMQPATPDFAFGERSGGYKVIRPKRRAFFFHYNKPASQSAGEPRLSIHYRGACIVVKGVECMVPVASKNRRTQPRCVMAGKARAITVTPEQVALIQ